MSQIKIEHNPSEERLQELGVSNWEIWEKEVSKFPIDFDETECAYILDGEILVTGAAGGVGSIAVALLGGLGYPVAASTGRPHETNG